MSILGLVYRRRYSNLEYFCCFIGYSRSGHTLIGSLLDAHPNVVIATEANAFALVRRGYKRYALFYYLQTLSKVTSKFLGNRWSGYNYHVPHGHQGRSSQIQIIGDKKGSGTIAQIRRKPSLLNKLDETVNLPIKYIHVIRNPFDIIATMHNKHWKILDTNTLTPTSDNYTNITVLKDRFRAFKKDANYASRLISLGTLDILNVYQEDLIERTEEVVITIMHFLKMENDQLYVEKCLKVVNNSPHKSRFSIQLPKALEGRIRNFCDDTPFLKRYSTTELCD